MIHKVNVSLAGIETIELELDDKIAPRTVNSFLDCLPLNIEIHVWGEELYTDRISIEVGKENSKSLVDKMDVAYWPDGSAICLFFGPTPIGGKDQIKPYSPVNVIGKIRSDIVSVKNIREGTRALFRVG